MRLSSNHPVFTEPPSEKSKGVWVRHKVIDTVGYISFSVKYHDYIDQPVDVYVVWPPTPHNKRAAGIKTYTGGVYQVKDLVRIKKPRRRIPLWFTM